MDNMDSTNYVNKENEYLSMILVGLLSMALGSLITIGPLTAKNMANTKKMLDSVQHIEHMMTEMQ